jgi:NAD(P)-dependent dehydrogenase (short-subunit alcohol dehydrogenase family)
VPATSAEIPPGSLVVGGANGIGRAISVALAARGDHVIVADLDGGAAADAAAEITAAQILDALEGPVALIECARHVHHCSIESTCGVGRAWQRVSVALRRVLEDITLVELAGLGGEPVRFAALERQLRGLRPERP